MLTAKIITKFIENHSEFSGGPNSCNKFVSSQSWYTMKLRVILLWKEVVLEVGVKGCKCTPENFDFLKVWAKALKIRVSMAPSVVWLQRMAPKVSKKTWRPFFGGHTKKRSWWSLWEKICRQNCTKKLFCQVWGNSGKNPPHSQKFTCSYTCDEKVPPPPLPPLKGQRGKCSRPASILRRPCAYYSTLSSLVVVGYNVSLKWT